MVWRKSDSERSDGESTERSQLFSLAIWGLVATTSFVFAFMALQFSKFDETPETVETAALRMPDKPEAPEKRGEIGIIQRGSSTVRDTQTKQLTTDVDLLRKEVIALRRTVSSIRQSRDQLAKRLAKVEDTQTGFTSSISKSSRQTNVRKAPVTNNATGNAAAKASSLPPDPLPLNSRTSKSTIGTHSPPLPPLPPKPRAAADGQIRDVTAKRSPLETALIPDQVVTGAVPDDSSAVAAPKRLESTEFGIDLGGFASLATLNKGWSDISTRQKDLLADLAPRASLSDQNGRLEVRLVAGPFANAAHAITLCAQLQAKGQSCQPTLFVGQPVVSR